MIERRPCSMPGGGFVFASRIDVQDRAVTDGPSAGFF
jgi:hypothetical protein